MFVFRGFCLFSEVFVLIYVCMFLEVLCLFQGFCVFVFRGFVCLFLGGFVCF